MSMRSAAGCFDRPGIVRMSPQMAYTYPAPAAARTSRTGIRQPVGAPMNLSTAPFPSGDDLP